MAFVSLNQKELQNKLNICNQVSPKRSDIDIFTYLKVEIRDKNIYFSAINSSLFFTTSITTNSLDFADEDIIFLIKTDIFASTVGLVIDENVGLDINLERNVLLVQGSKSKHTLRIDTQNLADFKLPVENKGNLDATVRILTSELLDANKAALVSVGQPKNVYQPEFLSVCYTLRPTSNTFLVVSTDRYRITKNVMIANYTNLSEKIQDDYVNYLISPKNLQLLSICTAGEESVELNFEKDFLWIKSSTTTLILRYSDGKYPDYEKIIPQSFTCTFLVNTKEILNSLRQVHLFAKTNTTNHSITLKVDPAGKKIVFTAQTQDGYASESSTDIEQYEGVQEEWTQSFNADYLIDYINNVQANNILWESNPGKPSVLSPENGKEKQVYLVSGLK